MRSIGAIQATGRIDEGYWIGRIEKQLITKLNLS